MEQERRLRCNNCMSVVYEEYLVKDDGQQHIGCANTRTIRERRKRMKVSVDGLRSNLAEAYKPPCASPDDEEDEES